MTRMAQAKVITPIRRSLNLRQLWFGAVMLQKAEGRRMNEETIQRALRDKFSILHSAFFLLHSFQGCGLTPGPAKVFNSNCAKTFTSMVTPSRTSPSSNSEL